MREIICIYGNGRGKTTNAIGRLMLELSNNKKALVIQFLKTGKNCGECNFFQNIPSVNWICIGKNQFYDPNYNYEEFHQLIQKALESIKSEINQQKPDLLLLDELGIILHFNLINLKDLYPLLECLPRHAKIILTGRKMPEELKKRAKTLVFVEEKKHPFQEKIIARKGYDY